MLSLLILCVFRSRFQHKLGHFTENRLHRLLPHEHKIALSNNILGPATPYDSDETRLTIKPIATTS
ncbi:hypothetical protein ANAPC1_00717 [Anaplasma phagocytophilum]|uniref:Uncharacterized protein n=1 Tax=Anaplasma phagocytophilum TaxID=948 RepID=A0AA45ZHM4_ANAPH|nr:hypothetical protein ANAPC1_00717 [Anaplasma phagocytophilum]SBO30215.1 hypothetical protein ANAPC4_00131 [Anaplasma phagocytophilum]SBO31061.1 hypothetical protein ANAPC3_00401 [Anaplasma phagocytophilum]SBO31356.1 hypothetical protein ANAPC2_00615 [Anaplasma phagocytophilum]SCV62042.1 hypothetical protein ANAPC5_00150 [Anaplasma phagocytophilum]